jgi:spermidine/putrescine ABC transporter ATP-binding subunit
MRNTVEVRKLTVRYSETVALRDVSVTLEASQFVTVLGPSGCGKTTLLRVLAGFVDYEGHVLIGGEAHDGMPPHKRDIGIVFQDYALFPHMTVAQNIAFGLRMRGWKAAVQKDAVIDVIRMLRLDGLAERYPNELSGGQQQRVALARAIAINPKLLLLDEPLAALDKKLREEMQVELRQLQQRLAITTMFVTHDQEEALALSDKIIVMNHGEVRQLGTPMEVYEHPNDRFVADFIGTSNLLAAQVVGREADTLLCQVANGILVRALGTASIGAEVFFSVRPERLRLARKHDEHAHDNHVPAVVEHITYLGHRSKIRVRISDGSSIEIDQPNNGTFTEDNAWNVGETADMSWEIKNTVIIYK